MIIKNIRAVDPSCGMDAIVDLIADDRILSIGPHVADGCGVDHDTVLDGTGLTVLPGLVDMHCHLRDPGQEYKEDIASGSRAALKGGFTSIACMPNTKPVADNRAVISYILERAADVAFARIYPIGAISKNLEGKELAEMGDMKEAGAIAVSDDGKPVMSSSLMKKAMIYASQFGLPVISHCEDLDLVDDGYMNEGYVSTFLGLRGIPKAAEEAMVSRELILAEYTGLPIHIAHVSTRLGVELIRQAKGRGVPVTCETCPHYFTLTDQAVMGFDTNAKVNPPLREQADVDAIIQGLQDGTIDAIATDHAPHHQDEKLVEFALAANGISGLETAFALSYTHLVLPGYLSLAQLTEKLSCNPGRILGVGSHLETGSKADLTIVDCGSRYTVDVSAFVSKGKNSPFHGFAVQGKVRYTIVDGVIRYEEK